MSKNEVCAASRCGKAASLAPCYTRPDTGEKYHFQCIMISLPLEKHIALEPLCNDDSLDEFQKLILSEHNVLREPHGSPKLAWSKKCEEHAQQWVEYLLKKNKDKKAKDLELEHDDYAGMGENLYLQAVANKLSASEAACRVTKNWYSEEPEYDYTNADYNEDTAHFSQVVWKGSWKMGAAYGQIGHVFVVVANYWPAGNVNTWFLENVKDNK